MTAPPDLAALLGAPDGRRALAAASPAFFDSYYCGMRSAPHRSRWLATLMETIEEHKRRQTKGRLLLLAPRDHGKTELVVTLATMLVCMNRDIRVLWISEAAGVAVKRMRRVRTLLESPRIVEDWTRAPLEPFRVGDDQKWTDTQIYVKRSVASVDPTVEAVGSGGSITGGHFDLIIGDDLEDDRTTFSMAQREKTRGWFNGTVQPMLVRGGCMIVVGTRKHADDLYGHLLRNSAWRTVEDRAIQKWPESFNVKTKVDPRSGKDVVDTVDVVGASEVLWPSERPIEYLLAERHVIGSPMFAREFQHEIQDDSTAAVRWEWIERALRRGAAYSLGRLPADVPPEALEIVQGWDLALVTDPARAARADSDYTVGTTWARDRRNGDRYLLGLRRVRGLTPGQLRGEVLAEFQRFKGVAKVAVERNAFGELHFLGLQRTTDLPLVGHVTTGQGKADAWDGVPSIATLFENGKVVLPSMTQEDRAIVDVLTTELWGLGKESHDDTVMSLWIAECVLRKIGGFEHRFTAGGTIYEGADAREEHDRPKVRADQRIADTLWDDLRNRFDFDDAAE